MNPSHVSPAPLLLSVESPTVARLSHSRERLAAWLAADRVKRARPSLAGWAASAVWPLINGLREHHSASLALGALAQGLLRPAAPMGHTPTPVATVPPALVQGLTLVRRHPRTVLAVVAAAGAVWLWRRSPTPRFPHR